MRGRFSESGRVSCMAFLLHGFAKCIVSSINACWLENKWFSRWGHSGFYSKCIVCPIQSLGSSRGAEYKPNRFSISLKKSHLDAYDRPLAPDSRQPDDIREEFATESDYGYAIKSYQQERADWKRKN